MINNIAKVKGYVGIATRGNYTIIGADLLKSYNHKLFLVLYREDGCKTIDKVLEKFKQRQIPCIKLTVEDFISISGLNNCKIIAIKNKGLADQIIKYLN